MENFVFPDEIKAKLMKMNEEHFLHPLKLCKSAASFMLFSSHLDKTYKPPHDFSKVQFFYI